MEGRIHQSVVSRVYIVDDTHLATSVMMTCIILCVKQTTDLLL